jgi:hypothetical protein
MFEQVRWSLLLSLTVCGTGQDDHELSGPYGCQRCKPVVAGDRILHGRSRGLLDKVNL